MGLRSRHQKWRSVLQPRLHPADPLINRIQVNLELQAIQLQPRQSFRQCRFSQPVRTADIVEGTSPI
jgi:hypothetical protein